jgi:hypothetical protein
MAKFRHYLNIKRMPARLACLLRDFSWGRVDHVFAAALAGDISAS